MIDAKYTDFVCHMDTVDALERGKIDEMSKETLRNHHGHPRSIGAPSAFAGLRFQKVSTENGFSFCTSWPRRARLRGIDRHVGGDKG